MDIQKELNRFEEELHGFNNFGVFELNKEELIKSFNKLKEAINYSQCCTTLKIKELMTFEDYRDNLFIKADGVYQPKKSKLFRWYSEKQLKKMYNNEPL